MTIAVLGAGSWGTALAILLGRNGHNVLLLGRDPDERELMLTHRENRRYLPDIKLPFNVAVEDVSISADVELLVIATPAASVSDALLKTKMRAPITVVASKGLEESSGKLIGSVVADMHRRTEVALLSGPNLAVEMVRGVPSVAVAAAKKTSTAESVRDAFCNPTFRVSLSTDLVGVGLAGALKNVLAIGAGMSDGLGFGDNTKGALLSRGLLELARLGAAMGAHQETFLGPAGVGDLFATAVSRLSRNYRVGRSLGEGETLLAALHAIGQVAEGVPTAHATMKLALDRQVQMPVFAAIDAVIQGRLEPRAAVGLLMERGSSMHSFIAE